MKRQKSKINIAGRLKMPLMGLLCTILTASVAQAQDSSTPFERAKTRHEEYYRINPEFDSQTVLPQGHSQYSILQPKMDQVFSVARELYPSTVANFSRNFVLLVADSEDTPVGEVHYTDDINYMVIAKKFIEDASDEALLGLLAHELAHVLLHRDNQFTKIFYKQDNVLAIEAEHDPRAEDSLGTWIILSAFAGGFPLEAFVGMPAGYSSARMALKGLIQNSYNQVPGCETLQEEISATFSPIENYFSWIDYDLRPQPNDLLVIEDLSQQMMLRIRDCAAQVPADEKWTLRELSDYLGFNFQAFSWHIYTSFKTGDTDYTRYMLELDERIIAATRDHHQAMRQLEALNDFSQMRLYTWENQADEFAVTILKKMGIPIESYFQALIDYSTEDEDQKNQCYNMVNNSLEPPFGNLKNDHGSPCWRYYNAKGFAQKYETYPGFQ